MGVFVTRERDVQLALVDGMERPTGPILQSVFQGTNADLMAAVAPIYLTGSVLDVTYGNGDTAGGWWRRFTPDPFTFHDLTLDGVDFRDLPHDDDEFDAVCFDPPYVPAGGSARSCSQAETFRVRFGIDRTTAYGGESEAAGLILDGLAECARVANTFLLVKCMEFVSSRRFHDMPTLVSVAAQQHGWEKHDVIVHHTGSGPGGHNIFTVKRARRAHSYLLVFVRKELAKR